MNNKANNFYGNENQLVVCRVSDTEPIKCDEPNKYGTDKQVVAFQQNLIDKSDI